MTERALPSSSAGSSPPDSIVEIDLPIAGMTCASCVNRIERFLRKSDGVESASVNLATEVATIRYLPERTGRSDLARAIGAAGYDLKPPPSEEETAARLRRGWYLVAVAIASLAIAGGVIAADRAIDAGAVTIDVRASDVRFAPADLSVPAGRFVVVRFTNGDPAFHVWMIEDLANVDAGARPSQTQRIRFRIDTPGTYRIICSVEGHAEAGMVGQLVVTP